jgi:hypothetical protein
MIRMLNFISGVIAVSLTSACTSVGRLTADTPPPSQGESAFILGVTPADHRVSFFRGTLKDGRFSQNQILPAVLYSTPLDGFVVGKAAAGDVIAVTIVRVVPDAQSVFQGTNFSPCGDAKAIVFKVPAGKVAYMGSVDFALRGKQLTVRYGSELEAAKRFLASHYPTLADRVEAVPFGLYPTSQSCDQTQIVIPIYIPRTR